LPDGSVPVYEFNGETVGNLAKPVAIALSAAALCALTACGSTTVVIVESNTDASGSAGPDATTDTSAPDGIAGDVTTGDATMDGPGAAPESGTTDAKPGGEDASDAGSESGSTVTMCNFPSAIYDTGAPANAATLFGPAGSGALSGGPCLSEPQVGTPPLPGALFPNNWTRPRFALSAPAGQDLFEIRVSCAAETQDLVVYTTNATWTMPKALWTDLASNYAGPPITVTVRGVSSSGGTPSVGTSGTFAIAPAPVDGALIYWATAAFDNSSQSTTLEGFHVGDEKVVTALTTPQVAQPVRAPSIDGGNVVPFDYNRVFCVGCHTGTPDGQYLGFTAQWPWAGALAAVGGDAGVGSEPPWLTTGAISNLSPNINGYYQPPTLTQVQLGVQTYSKAHYATGDRVMIASLGSSWDSTSFTDPGKASGVITQLAWFDLEWTGSPPTGAAYNPWQPTLLTTPLAIAACKPGTAGCATSATPGGGWGILQRTGDAHSAGSPSWSHDGNTIAYSSTDVGVKDGRMDCSVPGVACASDVYLMPYGGTPGHVGGSGGAAKALPGAADGSYNEYYPAFSPDDALVAFNRVPAGTSMYAQPLAEVYVVPSGGAPAPVRLTANDPVACTGAVSPGVQNTWPRWAPSASVGPDGKVYYWVAFGSSRSPAAVGKQQIYGSAVVRDPATGSITTYPAIYAWNQDPTMNNLIPAWDEFAIGGK
jgi:hypothetical protein